MKDIVKALEETRKAVLQVVLFNSIIDILVMFLILVLICILFAFPVWWAVLATIVYAAIHLRGNLKEVKFSKIEEKTPALREQLITVADSLHHDNEIVNALRDEVLKNMKEIKTSSFIEFGKLTREIAVMALVSFIIIGAAAFNVQFLDFSKVVDELKEFKGFQEYDINEELLEFEESQNLSEILGDESIAELGQQQLDLEISRSNSDVVIGQVNDPRTISFDKSVPPLEIKASSDASYEEDIPKEYQKIVKNYFREITKS
ncbi:hypothetical protein COV18_07340 [Candidatus Woesearchaeota archaeon CG10_big_fil_rev_8_21_14_0_10_37_12]|nr:MAG: hypothetical protein COV18_07340 [Candidatus Woesearchaeota archaeon CG10_big_fil_rev_8_21_14_0_10_37_12]